MGDKVSGKSYEDLLVWKAGIELASEVYRLTATFPRHELYGLSGQLQRAAASIPSNIAEGWGRGQSQANLNHARIARGSLYEVKTLLRIAGNIGLGTPDSVQSCIDSAENLRRILQAYVKSLEPKCN